MIGVLVTNSYTIVKFFYRMDKMLALGPANGDNGMSNHLVTILTRVFACHAHNVSYK